MNNRTAIEKGYRFTGFYERDKEELKAKKETHFTSLGYKAVIVLVPDSPYSRSASISVGYSIYAEQKYFDDERRINLQKRLQNIPRQKEEAKKDYEKIINMIETDALKYQVELNNLTVKK